MSISGGSPDSQLYARSFVDVYDNWYGDLDDPAEVVASVQRKCATAGRVLEFGSGTGRLATPLQRAGFTVVALDVSLAMLQQAPSGPCRVAADMTNVPVGSQSIDAAFVAYNTFFNLADRPLQQRCFEEAARVLRHGAMFGVEAFVAPTERSGQFGISTRCHPGDPGARVAIVTGPDPTNPSIIVGSHIELTNVITCRPWKLTYQSPQELDLAARAAGFDLVSRASDWSGTAFEPDGSRHVSWYKRG